MNEWMNEKWWMKREVKERKSRDKYKKRGLRTRGKRLLCVENRII